MDHASGSVAYEQREKIFHHGISELCQLLIGHPAVWNEQGHYETPCNESADVRHNHVAETSAKILEPGLQLSEDRKIISHDQIYLKSSDSLAIFV